MKATKEERMIQVPAKETVITVTMTIPEARALRSLMAHVGGDPATTRRCVADAFAAAIDTACVSHSTFWQDADDITGSIHFLPKDARS